ncbi:pilin [Patescibacteria group bacterium AH-259-L07]|nr:pilin [Patescibacteria group bacterium AH-259-L07]
MIQKNKIYIAIIVVMIMSVYLLSVHDLLAQEVRLDDPLNIPEGKEAIPELAGRIIKAVLGVVGVLALVMFIYGGILWMTSGGNAEKIKKGKDTIVWAVIGLAFIFFSYAILEFILKALTEKPPTP